MLKRIRKFIQLADIEPWFEWGMHNPFFFILFFKNGQNSAVNLYRIPRLLLNDIKLQIKIYNVV